MPDPVREDLPSTAREAAAGTDEPIFDAAAALVVHADEGPEPEIVLPKKKGFGLTFWVAVAFLAAIVLSAVFANFLPINDFDQTFAGTSRQGPTWDFPFGNDNIGQDVFSRTIHGARVSLWVAGVATVIGVVVGGFIGLVAGYFGGRIDSILTAVVDIFLAFPALVLALAIILFFDPEANNRTVWLIITLGLLSIAPLARIVRASTLAWAEREFVQAARTLGARDGRIMIREVLPNVLPTVLSYALVFMAALVVVESAIGFLGLSVQPPQPTWGDMISKGRNELDDAAHIALFPAGVLFLTVLSLNFIGDKLREAFDVRESFL